MTSTAKMGTPIPADPARSRGAALRVATAIAEDVAAQHAHDVDLHARFPIETVDALRGAKLLSTAVSRELGGWGCEFSELTEICTRLARSCASSGMIFAMHTIQVASILNHRGGEGALDRYLRDLARDQRLIASATSEVGTGGDLRRSIAHVESTGTGGDRFRFEKTTTVSSYCEYADDLLLTLRRDAESAAGDQVAVLVQRGEWKLADIGEWNTLGMRGTCSPAARITGEGADPQILPDPFRAVAAVTMVPVSHLLWAAVWLGIAVDATDRARRFLQIKSRKDPDGSTIAANRLAQLSTRLRNMRAQLESEVRSYEERDSAHAAERASEPGTVLALNDLKLSASESVVAIVGEAMQVIGIEAYMNEGEFSLARHLRDAHSAALMINNDRIRATNADLLLVYKGR